MSNKRYSSIAISFSVLLALLLSGCGQHQPRTAAPQAADSLYINGKIYTVDADRSWQQALAVRDGKLVAVGSNDDIMQWQGEQTELIDLQGRMVMPGIHDAHVHMEMAGVLNTHECQLPDQASQQQIVSTLQACHSLRPGGWITAGLYLPFIFPDARADNDFLTKAFPDTPVFLLDYSAHHGLANAKALELAGIDKHTADPAGGKILRDPATGELTGELVETAGSLIIRGLPAYQPEVYQRAMQWAVATANQYGVTSVQEASANRRLLANLNQMDKQQQLSLRVAGHLIWQYEKFAEAPLAELQQLRQDRKQYESERVSTRFIKFWLDGAPLPPNMTQADLDPSGHADRSKLLIDPEQLNSIIADLDQQGLTVKMHVAGEGAARTALDAIAYARQRNGDSGLLHELAHAAYVNLQDIKRMQPLGAVAEMSPAIWHPGTVAYESLLDGFKVGTMQANKVITVMGSDWWLTPTPNLFPAIEGMLDRGDESIDLASALETITINGARVIGEEQRIGSIEVGKDATFIVLDRNLFETPMRDVGETRVLKTVFEGRPVFELK
jgi:predicted amidohydrolase YtcJ